MYLINSPAWTAILLLAGASFGLAGCEGEIDANELSCVADGEALAASKDVSNPLLDSATISVTPVDYVEPEAPVLRVLSLNIFAGKKEMDFNRLKSQLAAVHQLNPDIVCLQEVYDNRVREAYAKDFPSFSSAYYGYDTPPDTNYEIATHLTETPGMEEVLNGNHLGIVTLFNEKKGKLNRDWLTPRIFAAQVSDGWLAGFFESLKPKGFVSARYTVGGVTIDVVNTHMSNGVHNPDRMKQVSELTNHLTYGDLVHPKNFNPVILCGDTNADGEEPEMRAMRAFGFIDSFLGANPNPQDTTYGGMTWDDANPNTRGNLEEPDQRVDYVGFFPGTENTFEVLSSKIVLDEAPHVSDHYGVLSELKLIKKKRF